MSPFGIHLRHATVIEHRSARRLHTLAHGIEGKFTSQKSVEPPEMIIASVELLLGMALVVALALMVAARPEVPSGREG